MISVIIPIYNEEKVLRENAFYFKGLSQQAEVIFVDGGSSDKSFEIAASYSKVLSCNKGRASQMNYGAKYSNHSMLLFLHADTTVSADTILTIERQLEINVAIGGCLMQQINKKGLIYRIIEAQGNLRARLSKIFYGDQGIFVKKEAFFRIGGFPEVPIFEDVLFTRELRRKGKTIVLPDKILVSNRRWEKRGIVKTTIIFNVITAMFNMGFPLEKIKSFYEDLR